MSAQPSNELPSSDIDERLLRVYSTIADIQAERTRRAGDERLRAILNDFWGDDRPPFITGDNGHHAFFSRPVITPNVETRYFLDIITTFKLTPLFLEYPGKFVGKNKEKRHAGKMYFFEPPEHRTGQSIFYKTIVDFNAWEGKPLKQTTMINGENLLDFHHRFFNRTYPGNEQYILDITEWFERVRQEHSYYYLGFLSLFIMHGVLFENYIMEDKEERWFFEEKVLPSFNEAERIFGVKPLIYPVLPLKDEKDASWLSYPAKDAYIVGDIHECETPEKQGTINTGSSS